MNRRAFSRLATAATLSTRFATVELLAQSESAPRALPTRDQIAWQDLEIGMFVHFAPNTWQDRESDTLQTPLSEINPAKLDTDQWARTALSFGAKYIVFVAKHQGGFCMWQTDTTDYSIKNTAWRDGKGDILADVAASCKKFGLKLGVYVCPRDDKHGAKTGGLCATPELQATYNTMYRQQWTEVLSRYGPLVECWFDGSSATPVGDLLAKYQPHAMVFQGPSATIRWVGNEDGFAPYPLWNGIDRATAKTGTATALNSDPGGDTWLPSEVEVLLADDLHVCLRHEDNAERTYSKRGPIRAAMQWWTFGKKVEGGTIAGALPGDAVVEDVVDRVDVFAPGEAGLFLISSCGEDMALLVDAACAVAGDDVGVGGEVQGVAQAMHRALASNGGGEGKARGGFDVNPIGSAVEVDVSRPSLGSSLKNCGGAGNLIGATSFLTGLNQTWLRCADGVFRSNRRVLCVEGSGEGQSCKGKNPLVLHENLRCDLSCEVYIDPSECVKFCKGQLLGRKVYWPAAALTIL